MNIHAASSTILCIKLSFSWEREMILQNYISHLECWGCAANPKSLGGSNRRKSFVPYRSEVQSKVVRMREGHKPPLGPSKSWVHLHQQFIVFERSGGMVGHEVQI